MALAWDGAWYERIAREGYTYSTDRMSSVVFFPTYPLAGRWLASATGLTQATALLVASNLFWLGALAMMAAYVGDGRGDRTVVAFTVLAMAVWPATFFCRVAYTEPLLALLTVTALYGMRRGWHPLAIAVVIGLATATRSVGVALLLPFALHLWDRRPRHVAASAVWMVVACWGVIAFMGFQAWRFHDPFAFVRAQAAWHGRSADVTLGRRLLDIVTFEPIRTTYDRSSPLYWNARPPHQPWFSLLAANPAFFVVALGLLVYGGVRRWLNREELVLGVTLIAIPYVLQGPRMGMSSMGRFVIVSVPIYLVVGHILARLPRWVAVPMLVLSAGLMCSYACLFSAGYFLY
jgi:hypothetical protein